MNKLTSPENQPINLDYIGGFTRIILKNEKKVFEVYDGYQNIF